ncbi:MAG: Gfo/Idh/MocA family protein [Candidatus Tectimicrobiota bacterium]
MKRGEMFPSPNTPLVPRKRRPRLGFLGVGWIGQHRLRALVASHLVDIVAVADPLQARAAQAVEGLPGVALLSSAEALLTLELDGVVIATPSALHAAQAREALARGLAVFCQKPLARTAVETREVVRAARAANRLLGVDLSYRGVRGMASMRELIQAGDIGEVYAAELVFHNAYGPDQRWFYDPVQSGGGCVIDLGLHLVDLALWTLDFPRVTQVSSRLFAQGRPMVAASTTQVEDYAIARLDLASGATVSLACSWRLPLGRDAMIAATFYGTQGGLACRNVAGSFYDFRTERWQGTTSTLLHEPPDDWGGRSAIAWAHQLASQPDYDPAVESVITVAEVLDAIYGR